MQYLKKLLFSRMLVVVLIIVVVFISSGCATIEGMKEDLREWLAPKPSPTPATPASPIPNSPESPQITPITPLPPNPPLRLDPIETGLLELINQERTLNGQHKLAWAGDLYDKAKEHSNWMVSTGVFAHSEYTMYYENICMINAYTESPARRIFNAWLDSPKHRDNLLSPQITRCGIGIAKVSTTMYATWIAE